ncbi:MAG: thioredoxin domain-containing protein, partial [Bacteroidetes bacterium]|nr:thioredoxin domain-containing protein [Bacteroidota bacterium]
MARFTNRLAKESSPYLLQHAHNPVDWYPWGEEALAKAKTENKPILVSIGYAACHWCHVMEHESFEDEATAAIMNANFICIKIDREERPDLDHIYMDALQAMVGNGGWPLNVFLTPEGKPFYGGTYFPPKSMYNRPSWKDVLIAVAESYAKKTKEVHAQANNLTDYLIQSNSFGQTSVTQPEDNYSKVFNREISEKIYSNIIQIADKTDGGFGRAPKFPQTFSIQFLLQHYYFTKNEDALQHACFSLDKMIAGGIHDHLGGGFARYSTDAEWLAPHFEKMLYDNALLIITLSEAYQLTKKELYKEVITGTMEFICRELCFERCAFYSSLDADSEGEEGRYYVWAKAEIDEILQEDSALFCNFYNITDKGNWEGKNILRELVSTFDFAKNKNIPERELRLLLNACKKKLFERRNQRIKPLLDDKILLNWNALMNIACSKAFAALGNEEYKKMAIESMDFLLQHLKGKDLYYFYHSFKENEKKSP